MGTAALSVATKGYVDGKANSIARYTGYIGLAAGESITVNNSQLTVMNGSIVKGATVYDFGFAIGYISDTPSSTTSTITILIGAQGSTLPGLVRCQETLEAYVGDGTYTNPQNYEVRFGTPQLGTLVFDPHGTMGVIYDLRGSTQYEVITLSVS
jgi:hypothetical protein